MSALPTELRRVIDLLRKLPGVGERTALRYALTLCQSPADALSLSKGIAAMATTIGRCSTCGNLARMGEACDICNDSKRDANTIAVVASVQHVLAFERTKYRGRYHVMSAMVNPLEGINADDIRADLDALAMRLTAGMELILAFDSSTIGDATAMVIAHFFDGSSLTISRIARGVQANGDIGEADAVTLGQAVGERRQMEN